MTFKEQITEDNLGVFMNTLEFADTHAVNDVDMPCIIDTNELIDREKRYLGKRDLYADGVYIKQLLIYVRAEDFGQLPGVGRSLKLDKRTYIVSDAINEDGIYSINLEANKT